MTLPFINALISIFRHWHVDTFTSGQCFTQKGKRDWLIAENSADKHQHYEKNIMKCDFIPMREKKLTKIYI